MLTARTEPEGFIAYWKIVAKKLFTLFEKSLSKEPFAKTEVTDVLGEIFLEVNEMLAHR